MNPDSIREECVRTSRVDPVGGGSPPVYVIVLNYNGEKHLRYALPSLAATDYPALRILVVDNASTDGSLPYLAAEYPGVEVLALKDNRGWSGGNNAGIRHALRNGARHVVLANNDIRVDPRWLKVAVSQAEADARIGIVGFRILEPAGGDEDAGFTGAMAAWKGVSVEEGRPVDGMAMFVRASVFERIGLIDEVFFAYAEDNDFERRVRNGGYRVIRINIPIWHHGQGSFGKIPVRAGLLQIRNNIRLSLKHDGPAGWLYQLVRHFLKGCVPFWPIDKGNPVDRRLHPSVFVVNIGLYLYAIAWNLLMLRATWRQRRCDRLMEAGARAQWVESGSEGTMRG